MAALSYWRFDHVVAVTVEPPQRRSRLSRVVVTAPGYGQWSTRAGDVHGLRLGGLAGAFRPIRPLHVQSEVVEVDRVVVETPPEWADAPWESALAKWAGGRVIVRAATVPPPYAERPLALPLRIAQVVLPSGPRAGYGLRTFLDQVSYRARQQYAVDPVATMSTASKRLDVNLRRRELPTLDAMQLDGPLPGAELLDAYADTPGSLGWIERLAGLHQLRLLVLPAADPRAQAGVPASYPRRVVCSLNTRRRRMPCAKASVPPGYGSRTSCAPSRQRCSLRLPFRGLVTNRVELSYRRHE